MDFGVDLNSAGSSAIGSLFTLLLFGLWLAAAVDVVVAAFYDLCFQPSVVSCSV